MALSVGSRLGPYEILSPLGAGGMGEVYRAMDTKLDREVRGLSDGWLAIVDMFRTLPPPALGHAISLGNTPTSGERAGRQLEGYGLLTNPGFSRI